MTRRFIGEYRSNIDLLYKQKISLDNGLLEVEIVDISAEIEYDFPMEQVKMIKFYIYPTALKIAIH